MIRNQREGADGGTVVAKLHKNSMMCLSRLVSSISVSFTSTLTSALLLSSYLLLTFPSTLPQTGLLLSSLTLSSLTAANFVFEEM